MTQDTALLIQDYLQNINREMDHPNYMYWFEPIDYNGSSPQDALHEYYHNNESDNFVMSLSDFMLMVEEISDWEEVVFELTNTFGLESDRSKILKMLTELFEDTVETWRVTPKLHSDHKAEIDDSVEDIIATKEELIKWEDILFRYRSSFYILHMGFRS